VAERAIALSEAHEYPAWRADLVPVLHDARRDTLTVDDLRSIEQRTRSTRTTRWRRVFAERVLAAMYGRLDRPDEGLRLLNAQTGDAGLSTPEIHRLRGELTLQARPGATDEAERCFRAALEDACRRQQTSLALRAAMSLYRLRHRRGDDRQERRILSDLHASFAEGFSTADLISARQLLG
jgi:hypothetical protein